MQPQQNHSNNVARPVNIVQPASQAPISPLLPTQKAGSLVQQNQPRVNTPSANTRCHNILINPAQEQPASTLNAMSGMQFPTQRPSGIAVTNILGNKNNNPQNLVSVNQPQSTQLNSFEKKRNTIYLSSASQKQSNGTGQSGSPEAHEKKLSAQQFDPVAPLKSEMESFNSFTKNANNHNGSPTMMGMMTREQIGHQQVPVSHQINTRSLLNTPQGNGVNQDLMSTVYGVHVAPLNSAHLPFRNKNVFTATQDSRNGTCIHHGRGIQTAAGSPQMPTQFKNRRNMRNASIDQDYKRIFQVMTRHQEPDKLLRSPKISTQHSLISQQQRQQQGHFCQTQIANPNQMIDSGFQEPQRFSFLKMKSLSCGSQNDTPTQVVNTHYAPCNIVKLNLEHKHEAIPMNVPPDQRLNMHELRNFVDNQIMNRKKNPNPNNNSNTHNNSNSHKGDQQTTNLLDKFRYLNKYVRNNRTSSLKLRNKQGEKFFTHNLNGSTNLEKGNNLVGVPDNLLPTFNRTNPNFQKKVLATDQCIKLVNKAVNQLYIQGPQGFIASNNNSHAAAAAGGGGGSLGYCADQGSQLGSTMMGMQFPSTQENNAERTSSLDPVQMEVGYLVPGQFLHPDNFPNNNTTTTNRMGDLNIFNARRHNRMQSLSRSNHGPYFQTEQRHQVVSSQCQHRDKDKHHNMNISTLNSTNHSKQFNQGQLQQQHPTQLHSNRNGAFKCQQHSQMQQKAIDPETGAQIMMQARFSQLSDNAAQELLRSQRILFESQHGGSGNNFQEMVSCQDPNSKNISEPDAEGEDCLSSSDIKQQDKITNLLQTNDEETPTKQSKDQKARKQFQRQCKGVHRQDLQSSCSPQRRESESPKSRSPKHKGSKISGKQQFDGQESIVKTTSFVPPIVKTPQVFMFDGCRKRKVILRQIKPRNERLKEF